MKAKITNISPADPFYELRTLILNQPGEVTDVKPWRCDQWKACDFKPDKPIGKIDTFHFYEVEFEGIK